MANPEDFGAVAAKPEDFGAVPSSTTADVIKSIGQGIVDAPLNISAALRGGMQRIGGPVIGGLNAFMEGRAQDPANWSGLEGMVHSFGQTQQDTINALSNLHTPETTAGKYARAGTGGAVTGLVAGPAGALPGLTAGLGGQAGHDLGAAVGYPKTGEVVGSLAGGFAPLAVKAATAPVVRALAGNDAERSARELTRGMTPQQWDEAIAMQQRAKDTGVPLSGAESTGNNPLLNMQRTLEQQPGSSQVLTDFYSTRPQNVTDAANRAQVPLGVRGPVDPALVGRDTQQAAELALKRAEQGRTNATAQEYATADMTRVTPRKMFGLLKRIDSTIAGDKTGTIRPILQEARDALTNADSGLPLTTIEQLGRAKSALNELAKVKAVGEVAGKKEASKYIKNFVAELDAIMQADSRAFRNATADFKAASPAVDDKIAGTTGALKETVDPTAQWSRLVDPELSRPGTVNATAKDLLSTDPKAYQNLVRVGIEGEINAAMKATANPGNQSAGALIAKSWYGTPQRLENVRTAVSNLPNGADALKALDNVMTVFRQTGFRQGTGSPTASNAANVGMLGARGAVNTAMHPVKGFAQNLDIAFTKRSATRLAKILTSPDAVEQLRKIAQYNPIEPYARAGIISVLNAEQEDKQ